MSRLDELKQGIVDIVKKEYRLQMVNMFEGNVSVRYEDKMLITPSQINKEIMTPEMIIETDMEGNILYQPENLHPSSETKMHLEVYHVRSDIQAVVHNHSIYATAYAINGMPIVSDALTEMNVTFGQVPVVPYGTPGTDRIYRDFDKYLGNYSAVLLANHGVLAFGQGLEKAFSVAEAVEKVAQTLYIARQLGEPSPIPKEEVKALREFGEQMRIKEIENIINLENKRS